MHWMHWSFCHLQPARIIADLSGPSPSWLLLLCSISSTGPLLTHVGIIWVEQSFGTWWMIALPLSEESLKVLQMASSATRQQTSRIWESWSCALPLLSSNLLTLPPIWSRTVMPQAGWLPNNWYKIWRCLFQDQKEHNCTSREAWAFSKWSIWSSPCGSTKPLEGADDLEMLAEVHSTFGWPNADRSASSAEAIIWPRNCW